MFQKLKQKIELKRKSEDLFSMSLVFIKDFFWRMKTLSEIISANKPNPEKIELVNFAVTYKCNSKCKNCNIWKKYRENPEKAEEELSLKEIKKIFNSKYLKNLKTIGFTGGETFLRKDFVELCGFFIRKYSDAHIGIPTNAVQPDLILEKLKEIFKKYSPKKFDMCVSLDGIGKTHDKIRGVSGNYKSAIKLIKGIKKQFPLINLGVGFTISNENYKDLLKVYDFSKKEKIGFGFWFGQTSACFYDNLEKKQKEFKWDYKKLKEIKQMVSFIIEDMKKLKKIDVFSEYYLSNMVNFQKNPARKINCYSGVHSFFLDPYGDVYPCVMLNKSFGNAKKGFDKVWFSKQAKEIRGFIKKRKCSCWASCEISLSLSKNLRLILQNFWDII